MKLSPYTYDGNAINDGTNYVASIPFDTPAQAAQARTRFISRAGATPVYAGKEITDSYISLTITAKASTAAGRRDLIEQINKWFNIYDEEMKTLVVKDTDDSDRQYSIQCTPRSISAIDGDTVRILLARDNPIWQAVTRTNNTWSITATGDTKEITNLGNIEAYPQIEFTPTSYPSGGFGYSRNVLLYPTALYAFRNRPVEILGGLDTAALVTASKAQADGDDFRVIVDGVEVDRWFGTGTAAFNQTGTKCWIILDMPRKRESTLKTAIANTGTPSVIDIAYTTANKASITAMPNAGRVLIDSEEFTYSAKTITTNVLRLTVDSRADRGTSAASHSAGATVRWIPFDIKVAYGNSAADAPDIDDTEKPVINLATSTNASFVYSDFYDTGDPAGLRSAIWQPSLVSTSNRNLTNSGVYFGENLAADTDPAEVMGAQIQSYQAAGVTKADTATITWQIEIPDRVSEVTSSGYKFRNAAQWFTVARLQSSVDGATWVNEWSASQTTPTGNTWVSWTESAEAVPNTTRFLRFFTRGTSPTIVNKYMAFEVTSVTLTLVNYPTVSLGSEEQNFYVDATITNNTTGDSFALKYPMKQDETLVINCDPNNPSAKIKGQLVNIVKPDTNRSNWLPLAPGVNELEYTVEANSNVTVVIRHYDRMNYG